jgi:hypothetical protein
LEEHGEQNMVSPLEMLQLTSPSQTHKVSPLEGTEGCEIVAKMLRHVMPVKAVKIPMTMMKTRNAEITPLVGLLGHPLQTGVAPDRKLEVQ